MSVQGKEKVSIHSHENQCKWHTGRYEKCVKIIIQEKPPHKKSMLVTQYFQPCCEDSLSQQKLNCQLNSLAAGDTPVQTFYPERETERESRLPEWNTNQQVDIEGFLHL